MVARAGAGAAGEATLQGLRAAANYSVTVRARADRGLGPPSPPVYCATREDGKMKFEYTSSYFTREFSIKSLSVMSAIFYTFTLVRDRDHWLNLRRPLQRNGKG